MAGGPRVFLADFGLARDCTTGSQLTRTGTTMGTPAYMSPELARGEFAALSPASDVWALGCVLFELCAGAPPFVGTTEANTLADVMLAPAPSLRARHPGLPVAVEQLAAACLPKAAAARIPDAARLHAACERVLAGRSPVAGARRHPAAWAAATAGVAIGAGLLAAAWRRAPAPAPAATGPTAETLADRGWARRADDPAAGIRLLDQALAAEPHRHAWRLQLGVLHWLADDVPRAITTWAQVPAEAPEGPLARLYTGFAVGFRPASDGKLDAEAARPHLRPLRDVPGRVGRLARAALEPDPAAARTLLTDLDGWDAALVRALRESQEGDPVEARRAYDAVLAAGVRFPWALANRAALRADAGDVAGAVADLEQALALQPRSRLLAMNLGRGHLAAKDYPAAARVFGRLIDDDPRDALAWLLRGECRREAGDPAGALGDFDRAVALTPDDPHLLVDRGSLRAEQGDHAGARADLDRAVALAPALFRARYQRAVALEAAGDLAGALAEVDAALRLAPRDVLALYRRGRLRSLRGDPAGARADYDAALAVAPDHPEARVNRARLRAAAGDVAGAKADLDRVLAQWPTHPEGLLNRGVWYLDAHEDAAAVADFRALLSAHPDHALGHLDLGVALLRLGDHAGTIAAWRRFLALAPDHHAAAGVREWLAEHDPDGEGR